MKKGASTIELLGKIFFPGQAPWQQRTKMLVLLWTIAVGIITGGAIAVFMLFTR